MKKNQLNMIVFGTAFLFLNLLLTQVPAAAERDVVVRPAPKRPVSPAREVQIRSVTPEAKALENPLPPAAVPAVKAEPATVVPRPPETSPEPQASGKPKSFFEGLIERWFAGKS